MSQNTNSSVGKIAVGAGIGIVGTIIGLSFQFISRIIIARIWTQADYGAFYLAMVVLVW